MKKGKVNNNLDIFNRKYMELLHQIKNDEKIRSKIIVEVNDISLSPKELIDFCSHEIDMLPNLSNILILGGGYGREAHRFKLQYDKFNLYTLDISPLGEEIGREIIEDVIFLTGDMCDIEFEDNTFDVIFSLHSLEHTSDIDKTMSEVLRIIKDGGLFGLAYPYKWQIDEQHVYMFEDDIVEYMSKFGKVEDVESIEHQSRMLKVVIDKGRNK